MMVFGYDDAPEGHCEVRYDGVQVSVEDGVVGGRSGLGRGFEVRFFSVLHVCFRGRKLMTRSFKLD